MINNKKDFHYYVKEDMRVNLNIDNMSILSWIKFKYQLFLRSDKAMAFNYLLSLRKLEYANNCLKGKSLMGSIIYRYRNMKHRRLSLRYHIQIRPNIVGYGLYLPHVLGGGIILNCKSMGNYCKVNYGVTLGNKNAIPDQIPLIGDNVDLTVGCKVIGKVIVGNNVTIAPNSVVVKDVPENSIVSGIPAMLIKYKN